MRVQSTIEFLDEVKPVFEYVLCMDNGKSYKLFPTTDETIFKGVHREGDVKIFKKEDGKYKKLYSNARH